MGQTARKVEEMNDYVQRDVVSAGKKQNYSGIFVGYYFV